MRHLFVDESAKRHFMQSNTECFIQMHQLCKQIGAHLHVIDNDSRIVWNLKDHIHGVNERSLQANESCMCKNTHCVRDAMLSDIDNDDEVIIVIKDLRNACLCNFADRIFVVGEVTRACTQNSIPHHPVTQWFDCSRILSAKSSASKEVQRRQARLQRMEASKNE